MNEENSKPDKKSKAEAKTEPKRLRKCRVKLPDRTILPLAGVGGSAFDAMFDPDTLCATGQVNGFEVMVSVHQALIVFHKA